MHISKTKLDGVLLLKPEVFEDFRRRFATLDGVLVQAQVPSCRPRKEAKPVKPPNRPSEPQSR